MLIILVLVAIIFLLFRYDNFQNDYSINQETDLGKIYDPDNKRFNVISISDPDLHLNIEPGYSPNLVSIPKTRLYSSLNTIGSNNNTNSNQFQASRFRYF